VKVRRDFVIEKIVPSPPNHQIHVVPRYRPRGRASDFLVVAADFRELR
jgi:hypothetical protein